MGKKNKRKQKSKFLEKICISKDDNKKLNPFELKINKEKHQVLGRRQKKLIGLPTVSHKKSIHKRKNTILQEYVHRNKKNVFADRRLYIEGRKVAQVMQQRLFGSNVYELNNDEELTHRGQLLSNIEKMDEIISDSDDEQLHADFVEGAHFGGFLTEKKTEEPVKSRKDLIKEIIAESKKRKYEKQSEREAEIELVEKLDSEWKEIQHLVSKGAFKKNVDDDKNISSYDMALRQLKFEVKGGASNQTKKPEDILKEQREKQMKLEMDRKGRMNMCFSDDIEEGNNNFLQESVEDTTLLPARQCTSIKTNGDLDENIDFIEPTTCEDEMKVQTGNFTEMQTRRIPTNLEEFVGTVAKCSNQQLSLLIEQIIANNRSRLDDLGSLFYILLEYVCYVADDENTDIAILDVLIPYLYELTEISTNVCAQYLLSKLTKAEQHFQDTLKLRKHKLQYPKLSTLIILKVCCILFPTSDFRHLVTSPTMLFIMRILLECRVLTVRDILCGVFTCNLALECVSYSKRFLPEALNFLAGLLGLIQRKEDTTAPLCCPFEHFKTDCNFSEIAVSSNVEKFKLSSLRSDGKEINDTLKLQLIDFSVELLLKFFNLYKELPSCLEIFSSVSEICNGLCNLNFPEFVSNKISNLLTLTKAAQPKKYLTLPKRPLKCLMFIEPKIEENFDGRKSRKGNKQHLKKEKLKHKYKRELKGAIREIRHDNSFLASHWLNEQAAKDRERKEKVKKLYQELANQEGDIRAMKRRKF